MDRKAPLGRFVWRCERLLLHASQTVVSAEERWFVCAAELQREAGCEGRSSSHSQQLAEVRIRCRIQVPVRGPGSGGCVCAVRGQHIQVGLMRSSCAPAGAGRWRLGPERVHPCPRLWKQGTHR